MSWWRNIITGPDNTTVSIGRVLGIIVFILFVMIVPSLAVITVLKGIVGATDWTAILASMQVYIPAVILSVGGLIGLTAPSDPKG